MLEHETKKPLSKKDIKQLINANPKRKGLLKTYALVKQCQKACKPADRLFEFDKAGLVLGSLDMVRGLIQQVEYIANKKLDKDWHSKLEDQQKNYLLGYLKRFAHLDVMPFEFKPDHFDTSDNPKLRLDVDFFIRDKSTLSVYAIQLKHVTSIKEAGIASWFKLIGRHNSKLNKGIQQLQNLKTVLRENESARNYLISNGLTKEEIQNLKPVIVHNLGSVDMLSVQEDIWLYDSQTFKKVLTGMSATEESYGSAHYNSEETYGTHVGGINLDKPIEIIDAYTNDERFKHLRHFDAAKYMTREVTIGNQKVRAVGVGI